ncbi:transcriptional regulator [Fictibacillus macauensis ZFHKF-1]|uniref:Transcriptional regulator n=1 Tax=Fictibacillus macauensis ZFHKF-1 TaxID=1196324 RepID=I8J4F6_9BACL|nr:transcriptional regulator SplA domain-containing protein [Fictibacillus macauensis]EIT86656.1 transcriptional regulator [Fictibacillus macauensis ZFHKF-1]
MAKRGYNPGDDVYVIYRNPHTPSVANISQAEIVPHPTEVGETAILLHGTYQLVADDDAVFHSYEEAAAHYETFYGGESP